MQLVMQWLHRLAAPQYFYHWSKNYYRFFAICSALFFVAGLYSGLVLAPSDYQQGDAFRIIYIHVPSAFMSSGVYVFMTIYAIILLVWRIKLAAVLLRCSAILGAWFT